MFPLENYVVLECLIERQNDLRKNWCMFTETFLNPSVFPIIPSLTALNYCRQDFRNTHTYTHMNEYTNFLISHTHRSVALLNKSLLCIAHTHAHLHTQKANATAEFTASASKQSVVPRRTLCFTAVCRTIFWFSVLNKSRPAFRQH